MGGSSSRTERETLAQKPKIPIKKFLTLGPSGAGKSSLIYRLKHGELPESYITTIGIDFQILYYDGLKLQAWDYTGRERSRTIVRSYYRGATGIIFMIDSADASSFDEAMTFLKQIMEDEDINNLTIMIVANKQDIDSAVGPEVIEAMIKEKLKIRPSFSVFVMPMSVTTEDDHSMQLAYHLFVKTMKRKDLGKVPTGLIRHAWETAEKLVEDSEVELEDDDIDDADTENDQKTKVFEKNDSEKTKNKMDENEKQKERLFSCIPVEKKESIFTDPVHALKSLLIR